VSALPCGCCEPAAAPTPEPLYNRPGLPRIDYRAGTFGEFREATIEAAARRPELRNWTARSSDDMGIGLLECWAYIADVLTFYTERAANESFLRTARLRDSILHLAALVGYAPMPGVAATARLAFALDAGAELQLPEGLRVKSVPGQGQRAQTYETSAPLHASAALNAVQVLAPAVQWNPWAPPDGSPPNGGAVEPPFADAAREAFSPGTEFLLFSEGAVAAEEKVVTTLEERGPVVDLRFEPRAANPDLQNSLDGVLCRFGRRLRLFGHDAPHKWFKQTVTTTGSGASAVTKVTYAEVTEGDSGYQLQVPGGDTLQLDRVVDGLQPGVELVFASPSAVQKRTIKAVWSASAEVGPLSATVTQVVLDQAVWQSSDQNRPKLREVTVYELRPPEIGLWLVDFPRRIDGAEVVVALPADPPAIEAGRAVILEDAAASPVLRTVVAVGGYTSYGDGPPDYLLLELDSPLPGTLDAASAVLNANVVAASNGESVPPERLGSGDAGVPFQRFALSQRPLTHVPRAGAPHGAGAELDVRVAGLLWQQTQEFVGHAPGDRVYRIETADDATTTVVFGDGETGARPATGAEITASYRQGQGAEGRVHAGQLTSLLDRPKGLRGVTNPLPSEGGADPETLEDARAAAPAAVRTLGRVVSLRDFEDAARESALVAKAHAVVVLGGDETGVRVTVAGEDGGHLGPDAIAAVRADLDARRDPYRRLEIVDYTPIAVRVEATIIARDPARLPDDVQSSAVDALLAALAFESRGLGRALHQSDVLAALQSGVGVIGVDLDVLRYRDDPDRVSHGMPDVDVLAHVPVAAHEMVTLDPADLEVSIR
jgi:hypothetical protein